MNELTHLELYSYSVTDISPLHDLNKLKTLDLRYNRIEDISSIAVLPNLEVLDLESNSISDLPTAVDLPNLTILRLGYNRVSDISSFSNLFGLQVLDLNSNSIKDILSLSDMSQMNELDLSSNEICDISPLSGMTRLESLDLSFNTVNDISAVSPMTELSTLILWDNAVSDISALKQLTNVEWLDLGENKVSDISALARLAKMKWLGLGGNKVSDISSDQNAPLQALKAAEAIRVSLLELKLLEDERSPLVGESSRSQHDSPANETIPEEQDKPTQLSTWGIGIAGLAQMSSTGDLGLLGAVSLGLFWHWQSFLVYLEIQHSALGATVPVQQTTALFNLGMLRSWFHYRLFSWHILQTWLGIGGGVAIPWSRGYKSYPYKGTYDYGMVGYLEHRSA